MTSKILITDDDDNVRKALQDILTPQEYEVLTADDGTTALTILKSQSVELLITDLVMPEMSGSDLINLVRGKYKWQREDNAKDYFENNLTAYDTFVTGYKDLPIVCA